jgi:hypothetical protein
MAALTFSFIWAPGQLTICGGKMFGQTVRMLKGNEVITLDFLRGAVFKPKDIASLVRLPSKHVDPLSSQQRQSLERGLHPFSETICRQQMKL